MRIVIRLADEKTFGLAIHPKCTAGDVEHAIERLGGWNGGGSRPSLLFGGRVLPLEGSGSRSLLDLGVKDGGVVLSTLRSEDLPRLGDVIRQSMGSGEGGSVLWTSGRVLQSTPPAPEHLWQGAATAARVGLGEVGGVSGMWVDWEDRGKWRGGQVLRTMGRLVLVKPVDEPKPILDDRGCVWVDLDQIAPFRSQTPHLHRGTALPRPIREEGTGRSDESDDSRRLLSQSRMASIDGELGPSEVAGALLATAGMAREVASELERAAAAADVIAAARGRPRPNDPTNVATSQQDRARLAALCDRVGRLVTDAAPYLHWAHLQASHHVPPTPTSTTTPSSSSSSSSPTPSSPSTSKILKAISSAAEAAIRPPSSVVERAMRTATHAVESGEDEEDDDEEEGRRGEEGGGEGGGKVGDDEQGRARRRKRRSGTHRRGRKASGLADGTKWRVGVPRMHSPGDLPWKAQREIAGVKEVERRRRRERRRERTTSEMQREGSTGSGGAGADSGSSAASGRGAPTLWDVYRALADPVGDGASRGQLELVRLLVTRTTNVRTLAWGHALAELLAETAREEHQRHTADRSSPIIRDVAGGGERARSSDRGGGISIATSPAITTSTSSRLQTRDMPGSSGGGDGAEEFPLYASDSVEDPPPSTVPSSMDDLGDISVHLVPSQSAEPHEPDEDYHPDAVLHSPASSSTTMMAERLRVARDELSAARTRASGRVEVLRRRVDAVLGRAADLRARSSAVLERVQAMRERGGDDDARIGGSGETGEEEDGGE